ncbi:hypothetical protein [Nocardioides limicola]|uniref:hypothetical protein n=1 Tax=Nocardioides limicola TaxID=2803368 RepID=UPI00193B1C70|nr:hypothetical protein [Nocardioides sp. DJM-14]
MIRNRSLRPRARRTAAAGAALALALSLAACGGDGDEVDETAATSTPTAEPTVDEPDAPDAGPGDAISGEDLGRLIAGSMEGSARMSMSMTGMAAVDAEGVVDFTGEDPQMRLEMSAMGMQMEFVLLDGLMYMAMAEGCFVIDPEDESLGDMGLDGMTDSLDPAGMMELYTEGIIEASHHGTVTLDGEQMAHYTMVIDPSKLSEEDLDPGTAQMMPSRMAAEMWFDGDGRIRQMEMDMGSMGAMTAKYFDWGQPVTVEKPAGECVSFADMMG